jgi:hypothetical protein
MAEELPVFALEDAERFAVELNEERQPPSQFG